jgi:lysozyme family protein
MGKLTNYEIIAHVIEREGGERLVNDPDDPGGVTKWGISKKAHPNEDIPNLTLDDAVRIYMDDYWKPSKASKLPVSLQDVYFDMVVNMGQHRGVKVLQEACNHKKANLVVDGRIGPKTIKASQSLEKDRLKAFRIMHYVKLCITNKKLMKYYYGWFRRTVEI